MTRAGYDVTTAFGGRYELVEDMGGGASISAYSARDLRTGGEVVIKLLAPELGSFIGQERFLQGVRAAIDLHNDRIVPISDAGSADGLLYVASPRHNGVSLRDYLSRKRKLPVRDATRILRDVIEAISFAHERGVGHGALTLDRIFVTGSRAVVADFCLGPWLRERSNGNSGAGRPDELIAADVNALGTIAYELMSGRSSVEQPPVVERPVVERSKVTEPPPPVPPQPKQASVEAPRDAQGQLTPSNIRISNPHGVLMPGTRPAMPPPGTQRRFVARLLLYTLVALIPVAMVLWAILKIM